MPASNILSLNLLYLIILIVPGLLAVKLFLAITREVDQYSRLTAIVYSLSISILSIFTLYLVLSIWLGHFITAQEMTAFTLPNYIWGYFVHTLLSLLYGFLFAQARVIAGENGYISELTALIPNLDETDSREELWDLTFSDIYSDSEVRIVTQAGDIVQGEVIKYGQKAQERDLLISDPKRIVIDQDGNETYQFEDYGLYSYVHNQDQYLTKHRRLA